MKKLIPFHPIFLALFVITLLTGCYATGGEDPPPVATITEVLQEPEEISPTDTVKFTMIVSNLKQQKVSYSWSFGGKGQYLNGEIQDSGSTYIYTDSTVIYWTPAGTLELIFGTAQVKSLDNLYDIVATSFEIKYK